VPAAAVIPAPIAYAKIAVVEKLVVGFRSKKDGMTICIKNKAVAYPSGVHLCRREVFFVSMIVGAKVPLLLFLARQRYISVYFCRARTYRLEVRDSKILY